MPSSNFVAVQRRPEIVWTHLYSPRYLLVEDGIDAVFTPYLLDVMQNEGAEIGIHAHPDGDVLGCHPRSTPDGSTDDCSPPPPQAAGVLLTGYQPAERARIVAAAIEGLTFKARRPPSALHPAADTIAAHCWTGLDSARESRPSRCRPRGTPDSYLGCWHDSLEWSGQISPLTLPYRVNRHTILRRRTTRLTTWTSSVPSWTS